MNDDLYGVRPSNENAKARLGGHSGPVAQQGNAVGVVGLVSGILGLVCALCPPLGIVLGIVALMCGSSAKYRGQKYARASIGLGLAAIVLAFLVMIIGAIGIAFFDWGEYFTQLSSVQNWF